MTWHDLPSPRKRMRLLALCRLGFISSAVNKASLPFTFQKRGSCSSAGEWTYWIVLLPLRMIPHTSPFKSVLDLFSYCEELFSYIFVHLNTFKASPSHTCISKLVVKHKWMGNKCLEFGHLTDVPSRQHCNFWLRWFLIIALHVLPFTKTTSKSSSPNG